MKKINFVFAISFALSIIGCTSRNSTHNNDTSPAVIIPDRIEKPSVASRPLTVEQLKEAKQILVAGQKLPSGDAIWKGKDESEDDIAYRNEKITSLDNDGKALLEKIVANCEVQNPISKIVPEGAKPAPGAVQTRTKNSKISGEHCPVAFDSSEVDTVTYSKSDEATHESAGVFHQSISSKQLVNAQDISSITNIISKVSKSEAKGAFESTINSFRNYFESNFHDEHVTKANGTVTADMTFKLLSTMKENAEKHAEVSYIVKFKMPSSEVILVAYGEKNGDELKISYNLNGKDLSKQELRESLGFVPDISIK